VTQELGRVDETQYPDPSAVATSPMLDELVPVMKVSTVIRLQASALATTRGRDIGDDEKAPEAPAEVESAPKVMYLPEVDKELYPTPPTTPGRLMLLGRATVLTVVPSREKASK
jgi:hypothetical protein